MSRRQTPAELAELERKLEEMRPAVEKARQHSDDNTHRWPDRPSGFALKATTTRPATTIEATHAALRQTTADVEARNTAARASADHVNAVAGLLYRHGLATAFVGARITASKYHVDTLRALLQNRTDAASGRVLPSSHLALMRDLQMTPVKDATQ